MQVVVSHAWTFDAGEHAEAYRAKSDAFNPFLEARPGFVARLLVQGIDDPTHMMNIRVFESVEHYTAMTQIPSYADHIADLSLHVDPARYTDGYAREFTDLISATGAWPTSS